VGTSSRANVAEGIAEVSAAAAKRAADKFGLVVFVVMSLSPFTPGRSAGQERDAPQHVSRMRG
jgi:hypothetical protein